MSNEFVVDIEECLRTLSSQLVEGIEQAWHDREAGLGVGALYRFQGGLVRIKALVSREVPKVMKPALSW